MTKMKSFRLDEVDKIRLKKLAEKFNESETQIIKFTIRKYYESMSQNIQLPSEDELIAELVMASNHTPHTK